MFQWPGYESSGDFLCDCGSGTTRYDIGCEFARVWRDYMSVSPLQMTWISNVFDSMTPR